MPEISSLPVQTSSAKNATSLATGLLSVPAQQRTSTDQAELKF